MDFKELQMQINEMKSLILFCERRSQIWREADLPALAEPFEETAKVLAGRLAKVWLLSDMQPNSDTPPQLNKHDCTTQVCPYCHCEAVGFGGDCGDGSNRCMEC